LIHFYKRENRNIKTDQPQTQKSREKNDSWANLEHFCQVEILP
jgi:hypothetical protein